MSQNWFASIFSYHFVYCVIIFRFLFILKLRKILKNELVLFNFYPHVWWKSMDEVKQVLAKPNARDYEHSSAYIKLPGRFLWQCRKVPRYDMMLGLQLTTSTHRAAWDRRAEKLVWWRSALDWLRKKIRHKAGKKQSDVIWFWLGSRPLNYCGQLLLQNY